MPQWILIASLAVVSVMLPGCALLDPLEAEAPHFRTASEHYNKAFEYYRNGNYVQAQNLFHEYVARYPDSELCRIAMYYLGHCYQIQGDNKEALIIYNRIVTVYGDHDFWGAQAFKRIKQINPDSSLQGEP